MQKLLSFLILILIAATPLAITLFSGSIAEAQSSKSRPNVEILVASWCVHCRDLEKFLRSESIGYTRLDIEKDPEGGKLYQRLGGGGVPMVIIGNSVLKGFDKEAILELLDKDSTAKNSFNNQNANGSNLTSTKSTTIRVGSGYTASNS